MKFIYNGYGYIYVDENNYGIIPYFTIYYYSISNNLKKSINLSKQKYYETLNCIF